MIFRYSRVFLISKSLVSSSNLRLLLYATYSLNKPKPFESAEDALENCNNVSEGILSQTLKLFLEVNLPSVKKLKDSTVTVGVVCIE